MGCQVEELRVGASPAGREALGQPRLFTLSGDSPEVPGSSGNLPHTEHLCTADWSTEAAVLGSTAASCNPTRAQSLFVTMGLPTQVAFLRTEGAPFLPCCWPVVLLWGGEAAECLHGTVEPFLCPFPSLPMFLFHLSRPLLLTLFICYIYFVCTCATVYV